jgi:MarR family transcriptional regulator, organic hydroperoxide resistance regulator
VKPPTYGIRVAKRQPTDEVRRAPAEGDRRVKAVALTPAGVEVRNRLVATIAESPMFGDLTVAQRRQLARLLRRCVAATA